MKIKQKLNLGFIIIIILIFIPVGMSIFGFYKIGACYSSIEKLNLLSDLFYKQYLSINKYSHFLVTDELDDIEKNEKLTISEKSFLNGHNEAIIILDYLEKEYSISEGIQILNKIKLEHEYFEEVLLRIKEAFVNKKISGEKKTLALASINKKRDLIKVSVFTDKLQSASSTKDFFYLALSKYNEIKNLESSFLYDESKKEALDTLLSSSNNLETYIKESSLFDEHPNIFLLFKDYRDELDLYFAGSNNKNFDNYSMELEIRKLDEHLVGLFNGESNNALLRLKEIQNKKIKDIFLFLMIFNLFFVVLIFIFAFIVSKKISKSIVDPVLKLRDFSTMIGKGFEHKPLQINSNDEMGELAKVFNEMDGKLKQSNKDLLGKINELKIRDNIESLVESLTDGVIMYNKEKNIVLKNSAVDKILNISNKKLSLKNLYSIFAKHNLEFHIDLSLRTDQVYRIDNVNLFSKIYEVVITQVTDYNKRIVGGLIIFHQKENDKKYEHEDNTKFDFGPVISPHFGTPLSYIKLFTEMLSSGQIGQLNKEQKECISNIHQSAVNMKEVIDKLHDITILNNDELEIKTEEISIVLYLKGLIKKYKEKNKIINVNFKFRELLPEDMKVNIDKNIFSKVFDDILDNAIVYSNNNEAFVDIEIKELGFNYLVSIKDNGIGILEEEQDYIFNKFFRGKNAVAKNAKGSGISLYIAKKILNKVGVELFFESKIGEGTTFFIEIPKGGMRK